MKKLLLIAVILTCTVCGAFAQYYNNAPTAKFGLGLSSGFTSGAAAGAFPEAGGISANFEFPIGKSPASFLLKTGFTFYVSQGGYSIGFYDAGYGASTYSSGYVASFLPVEAGIKLYVARKFFIEGYAGASFNINSFPADYTGKTTALIYSPAAGYSFPMGYNDRSGLDVSLFYENRPEPGGGYAQVGVKGVWNFSL